MKEVNGVKLYELEEWRKKGKDLFHHIHPKLWKFVCPNCGHIQTVQDFIDLRTEGIISKDFEIDKFVAFSCIGRYDTRISRENIGTIFQRRAPCDYTLGGLLCLTDTFIIGTDGKRVPVFPFAEE